MIKLELDGAQQTILNLQGFGVTLREALNRSMTRVVIKLQAFIRTHTLKGGHPLNQRSGNLSRAITYDVEIESNKVTGIVGVDKTAPYGKVHEYGGTFNIRQHLSTSKNGIRFLVKSHKATYPERSFLRSALSANESMIVEEISKGIQRAIKGRV